MRLAADACVTSLISIISVAIIMRGGQCCQAACPNANDIKPCTCDDEGLMCLNLLNNSELRRVFTAPSKRQAIRRVWIFKTNLTELPETAFGDYIIRDLFLDLNGIEKVHRNAFGEASRTLQSLSLVRNSLQKLPLWDLANMKRLRQLGLGHNNLRVIKSGAFSLNGALESLDLSHNLIEKLEPNAFSGLSEVSLIDLSQNNLKEIGPHAIRVRSSNRHLAISLRDNQINKIAMDAFGSYHPYNLDLSRNKLTYLDRLTFEPLLTNNTIIYVEDNPFSCKGCHLYKWLLDLNSSAADNLINFKCLDQTKLEDLTPWIIGCTDDNQPHDLGTMCLSNI